MLSVHNDMVSSRNNVCPCYNMCVSVMNLVSLYVILDVCVCYGIHMWFVVVALCVCDRCVFPCVLCVALY